MQNNLILEAQINQEVADFFNTAPLEFEVMKYDNKNNLDIEWVNRTDGKYTIAPNILFQRLLSVFRAT